VEDKMKYIVKAMYGKRHSTGGSFRTKEGANNYIKKMKGKFKENVSLGKIVNRNQKLLGRKPIKVVRVSNWRIVKHNSNYSFDYNIFSQCSRCRNIQTKYSNRFYKDLHE
jgi:hypothetical protein